MDQEDRESPRIPYERPAEMDVRIASADIEVPAKNVTLPVNLCSLSRDGAGMGIVGGEGLMLTAGAEVVLRLEVDAGQFELPGRIAWYRPGAGDKLDVGVQLLLDRAPSPTRERYGRWLTEVLRARSSNSERLTSGAR